MIRVDSKKNTGGGQKVLIGIEYRGSSPRKAAPEKQKGILDVVTLSIKVIEDIIFCLEGSLPTMYYIAAEHDFEDYALA